MTGMSSGWFTGPPGCGAANWRIRGLLTIWVAIQVTSGGPAAEGLVGLDEIVELLDRDLAGTEHVGHRRVDLSDHKGGGE